MSDACCVYAYNVQHSRKILWPGSAFTQWDSDTRSKFPIKIVVVWNAIYHSGTFQIRIWVPPSHEHTQNIGCRVQQDEDDICHPSQNNRVDRLYNTSFWLLPAACQVKVLSLIVALSNTWHIVPSFLHHRSGTTHPSAFLVVFPCQCRWFRISIRCLFTLEGKGAPWNDEEIRWESLWHAAGDQY